MRKSKKGKMAAVVFMKELITLVSLALIVWVLMSTIDVISHNIFDFNYHWWNAWKLAIEIF